MHQSLSIKDLDDAKNYKQVEDRVAFLGDCILNKAQNVTLLGHIEPLEGKTTLKALTQLLSEVIGNRTRRGDKQGYPLFENAEDEIEDAAVLALTAVWLSIYGKGDKHGYWQDFYSALDIKSNPYRSELTSKALKSLIKQNENLVAFPEIEQETTWVHLTPIYMHGLPLVHWGFFIEEILMQDLGDIYTPQRQLEKWIQALEKKLKFRSTLRRFFRHGGEAALQYANEWSNIREYWNQHGVQPKSWFPDYLTSHTAKILKKQKSSTLRKQIQGVRQQPFQLNFTPERMLQPFVTFPERILSSVRPRYQIFVDGQEYGVYEPKTEQFGVISHKAKSVIPEDDELAHRILAIPPAKLYEWVINYGDRENLEIEHPEFWAFDANTGKRFTPEQDITWPSHWFLIVKRHQEVLQNGESIKNWQGLCGAWENWKYTEICQSSPIILEKPINLKLINRGRQKRPKIQLLNTSSISNWLRLSGDLTIFKNWQELRISMERVPIGAILKIIALDGEQCVWQCHLNDTQNELTFGELKDSIKAPGGYRIELESHLGNTSRIAYFLPGLKSHREESRSLNQASPNMDVSLPHGIWLSGPNSEQPQKVLRQNTEDQLIWQQPKTDLILIDLFPGRSDHVLLHLAAQDIRCLPYGEGDLPLRQARMSGILNLTRAEILEEKNQRFRVETSSKAISKVSMLNLQIRSLQSQNVLQEIPVQLNSSGRFFWDVNLSQWSQEIDLLKHIGSIELGLLLDKKYVPLLQINSENEQLLDFQFTATEQHFIEEQHVQEYLCMWKYGSHLPEKLLLICGPMHASSELFEHHIFEIQTKDEIFEFKLPMHAQAQEWGLYWSAISKKTPDFIPELAQYTWKHPGITADSNTFELHSLGFFNTASGLMERFEIICSDLLSPDISILAKAEHGTSSPIDLQLKDGRYYFDLSPSENSNLELNLLENNAPQARLTCKRKNTMSIWESLEAHPTGLSRYHEPFQVSWDADIPVYGKVYWIYTDLEKRIFEFSEAEANGSIVEFELTPTEHSGAWIGYLDFNCPTDIQAHHFKRQCWEWIRGQGGLRSLESAVSWDSVEKQFLNELDLPSYHQASGLWHKFLKTLHHSKALLECLGSEAFAQLSPFQKSRTWKLTASTRENYHFRPIKFEVYSHLSELTDDFKAFDMNYPLKAIYSFHNQGISTIEISEKYAPENHYLCSLEQTKLKLTAFNDGCKAIQPLQNWHHIEFQAEIPFDIWFKTQDWSPLILEKHSSFVKMQLELFNPPATEWYENFKKVMYSDRRRHSVFNWSEVFVLDLWLMKRKLSHGFGLLRFICGMVAIIERLKSRSLIKELPAHYFLGDSEQQSFESIYASGKQVLLNYIDALEDPETLLTLLLKDFMMAELIISWYIEKPLISTNAFEIQLDKPRKQNQNVYLDALEQKKLPETSNASLSTHAAETFTDKEQWVINDDLFTHLLLSKSNPINLAQEISKLEDLYEWRFVFNDSDPRFEISEGEVKLNPQKRFFHPMIFSEKPQDADNSVRTLPVQRFKINIFERPSQSELDSKSGLKAMGWLSVSMPDISPNHFVLLIDGHSMDDNESGLAHGALALMETSPTEIQNEDILLILDLINNSYYLRQFSPDYIASRFRFHTLNPSFSEETLEYSSRSEYVVIAKVRKVLIPAEYDHVPNNSPFRNLQSQDNLQKYQQRLQKRITGYFQNGSTKERKQSTPEHLQWICLEAEAGGLCIEGLPLSSIPPMVKRLSIHSDAGEHQQILASNTRHRAWRIQVIPGGSDYQVVAPGLEELLADEFAILKIQGLNPEHIHLFKVDLLGIGRYQHSTVLHPHQTYRILFPPALEHNKKPSPENPPTWGQIYTLAQNWLLWEIEIPSEISPELIALITRYGLEISAQGIKLNWWGQAPLTYANNPQGQSYPVFSTADSPVLQISSPIESQLVQAQLILSHAEGARHSLIELEQTQYFSIEELKPGQYAVQVIPEQKSLVSETLFFEISSTTPEPLKAEILCCYQGEQYILTGSMLRFEANLWQWQEGQLELEGPPFWPLSLHWRGSHSRYLKSPGVDAGGQFHFDDFVERQQPLFQQEALGVLKLNAQELGGIELYHESRAALALVKQNLRTRYHQAQSLLEQGVSDWEYLIQYWIQPVLEQLGYQVDLHPQPQDLTLALPHRILGLSVPYLENGYTRWQRTRLALLVPHQADLLNQERKNLQQYANQLCGHFQVQDVLLTDGVLWVEQPRGSRLPYGRRIMNIHGLLQDSDAFDDFIATLANHQYLEDSDENF